MYDIAHYLSFRLINRCRLFIACLCTNGYCIIGHIMIASTVLRIKEQFMGLRVNELNKTRGLMPTTTTMSTTAYLFILQRQKRPKMVLYAFKHVNSSTF